MLTAVLRIRALTFCVAEYKHPLTSQLLNMPPRSKRSSAPAKKTQPPERTSSTSSPNPNSRRDKSQTDKSTSRPPTMRRSSSRLSSRAPPIEDVEHCPGVIDGADALRASPDAENMDRFTPPTGDKATEADVRTPPGELEEPAPKRRRRAPLVEQELPRGEREAAAAADPNFAGDDGASPEELQEALGRPPPVNSAYLPLPWKGRLGYVSYSLRTLWKRRDPNQRI